MKKKVIGAYAGLLVLVFLSYGFPARSFDVVLPVYLLAVPVLLTGRFNAAFSLKQVVLGLFVSLVLILPFLILLPRFFTFSEITVSAVVLQFFLISFPEEVFFRGFVQDVLRNDFKGVCLQQHICRRFFSTEI